MNEIECGKEFSLHPLRVRRIGSLGYVFADRSGRFGLASPNRDWLADGVDEDRIKSLRHWGFGTFANDRLEKVSYRARQLARQTPPSHLDYLILIPTLRCNLSCSYCQVSRVGHHAKGFDWDENTLRGVERLIDSLETDHIKIEFQGGEPTLRLDIIERIIAHCERFASKSFVICTNLSELTPGLLALLDRDDVYVSTSLDGDNKRHQRQRTGTKQATEQFLRNLHTVIGEFGPDKVSALPTIDQENPPEPDELISAYSALGINSIYLRPINFQGFARKRHQAANEDHGKWWAYHESFLRRLIELNYADRSRILEESYFSLCLRRIFRIGLDRHVDLRDPNLMGTDYLVIDHDGTFYPTDEARMLTRSGVINLAIGNVTEGIDQATIAILNANATTKGDPTCENCPYQAYCGRDVIDDLSRYGRIDLPRHDTFFCRRHLAMFDLAISLIYSDDPATQFSLAKWLGLAGDLLPRLPQI